MSSPRGRSVSVLSPVSQATNPKKRALADSDSEQRDAKRTKPEEGLLETEAKKETKDRKKRKKKKRKVSVVHAQGPLDADAHDAPEASGSRSRSRSMTLAASPAPTAQIEEVSAPPLDPGSSEPAARGSSPAHSSSSKGKGRATPDDDTVRTSQQQITDLEDKVSSKANLVSQHETLLSSFQQSLSCQICLDLMHKPFALAPCGHSACHQCLVNWFKAPPPDVPANEVLPVWLRKKTCPHCRTAIRERPIEIWTIKDMVATLVKSGLAQAPLLPPPVPVEDGPANADPWSGIFRPAPGHHGIFPEGHPPALMQQLMGLRDDEDGGIYRCIDCHHEIEDGACSQCGRVYPGHDPLGHDPDELDDDIIGHWGDPGIWDDSIDEDEDEDSIADDAGGWGHLDMIRRLFNFPELRHDEDTDSSYSVESRHYDEPIDFEAEQVVFRPAAPAHPAFVHDGPHGEGSADEEDEEGYESSFIDDGGDDRPRRVRAPSVDLDRDSVIDLSEADGDDDGEQDEVEFVRFGRRRGGPAARGRTAIVITSEDEEDDGASHGEGRVDDDDASDDEGDLAAEVAAREYDMYGDDGSVPRRGARYEDLSDEDGEGYDDDEYNY